MINCQGQGSGGEIRVLTPEEIERIQKEFRDRQNIEIIENQMEFLEMQQIAR